ncbi:uncharacterized protein LOC133816393 [Humulus lupulus]|uniref:uncharacterized protein LOC133816393 n=1 Tax=Humulus lupulus TaxID=3486 RepID=UPI002B4044E1|nr:uncharacterized protein LOC133816393 [Humulus lupulus]
MSKPICDCGWDSIEHTSWTEGNLGRRFYGYPRYKRNVENGCRFLRWIDPPSHKNELVQRLDEVEDNLKLLHNIFERREKEVRELMKLMKYLKFGICISAALFASLLYLLVTSV